jgi:hypothetical protein
MNKLKRALITSAVVVSALGGSAGLASASTSSPAHSAVSADSPPRGNVDQIQTFPWGARIWLDHQGSQAAYRSVQASGSFSALKNSIPGVPSWLSWPLQHIGCTSQFINDVRNDDQGYGVVMDINWWAPFWSCGSLKVWSQ